MAGGFGRGNGSAGSFAGLFGQELALLKGKNGLAPGRHSGNHILGLDPNGQAVRLSPAGRRAHTHICGGSGRGKSYFLEHLIRQDFDDPDYGLCLLDPHGALYKPLVRYLAQERPELADRVVLFEPMAGGDHILGFNPIGSYAEEFPEYALNMLVGACLKAWGQDRTDRTPRIRRWLENIFAPIIVNGLTMIETAPLIATSKHSDKRALLLAALDHELIREDWDGFEAATSTVRQQLLEGSGNRLRKFLSNPVIRQVLGQQTHTLDIDRVIAEKKILLVNLAPGMGLDRENANLLGILLINELCRAAMLRDPDSNPHPFTLYIDEFAQLITPTVANILDECRKYGLFLTLAHQHLTQLKEEDEYLFASVLTNCHNRIVFGGLSADDAELLARQLYTGFEDLKRIKHIAWQTKFRPVEEERIVRSESRGHTVGWSEMFTETAGETHSHSRSLAEAISRGRTKSLTRSTNWSQGTSRTRAESESWQEGGQESAGQSEERGLTRNRNWSDGTNEQSGSSSGHTVTHQEGEQRGEHEQETSGRTTLPDFRTANRQTGAGKGSSLARTESDAESEQHQVSRSHGESHQKGGGETQSLSSGRSWSAGTSWGSGGSRSVADQRSISRGGGSAETAGESETRTETETSGRTDGVSRQESRGQGQQGSATASVSESRVPFQRMVEFREGQETFWTHQELEYIRTGELKEQPVGTARMKLGAAPPVTVRVSRLTQSPHRGEKTQAAITAFAARVAAACPDFYATPQEIQAEITARQTAVFGEVMRLNLNPVPAGAAPVPVVAALPPAPAAAPAAGERPTSGRFSDDDDDDDGGA